MLRSWREQPLLLAGVFLVSGLAVAFLWGVQDPRKLAKDCQDAEDEDIQGVDAESVLAFGLPRKKLRPHALVAWSLCAMWLKAGDT